MKLTTNDLLTVLQNRTDEAVIDLESRDLTRYTNTVSTQLWAIQEVLNELWSEVPEQNKDIYMLSDKQQKEKELKTWNTNVMEAWDSYQMILALNLSETKPQPTTIKNNTSNNLFSINNAGTTGYISMTTPSSNNMYSVHHNDDDVISNNMGSNILTRKEHKRSINRIKKQKRT